MQSQRDNCAFFVRFIRESHQFHSLIILPQWKGLVSSTCWQHTWLQEERGEASHGLTWSSSALHGVHLHRLGLFERAFEICYDFSRAYFNFRRLASVGEDAFVTAVRESYEDDEGLRVLVILFHWFEFVGSYPTGDADVRRSRRHIETLTDDERFHNSRRVHRHVWKN